MKIIIASRSGFCSGVERAVNMVYDLIPQKKDIYMLGELIHNRRVVESFRKSGIKIVKEIPKDAEGAYLITRSHGISPEIIIKAKKYGLNLVDTTCPFVKKVQELAKYILSAGYELVLVGDRGHAEIDAVLSRLPDLSLVHVISNKEDLDKFLPGTKRVGIVSQTTQSLEFFSQVVAKISKFTQEMIVYNTICEETLSRQREIDNLSKKVDVVIVIGGRNSANTNRLYNIAKKNCSRTFFVEDKDELKRENFKPTDTILLVSGASTPFRFVEEVKKLLESWDKEGKGGQL